MVLKKEIKFIRAVWGQYDEFYNTPPLNEIVYVWGIDKYKYLLSKGFDCVLVSEKSDVVNDNIRKFYHKLECLRLAAQSYEKFIFLDWDVEIIREFDDKFFSYLEDKEFLVPTYAYPIEFLDLKDKIEFEHDRVWVNNQIIEMQKYGWRLDNEIVLPNAGFIYCSNKKIPNKLIEISNKLNIVTLVEEFSIFNYVNCDLEYYILNYEPTVIFGRSEDNIFNSFNIKKQSQINLHNIINKLIKKDIYLIHN